jgi:predicted PhzF superfamily epimerase YddE/YHI9
MTGRLLLVPPSSPPLPVPTHDVLRVFCDPDGRHGNPLGVVRGHTLPNTGDRQALARHLGYSETIYLDDPDHGVIDIYTPSTRLPFAGHPCVGAAWLLRVPSLQTPAGSVTTRFDGDLTWITARPEWAPPRTLHQHPGPADVDALDVPPPGESIYAWAWADEPAGHVRARAFPGRGDGITEDEATGAAALLLTAHLARPLHIVQGRGSHLHTRPLPDGRIEIGGRVHPTTTNPNA